MTAQTTAPAPRDLVAAAPRVERPGTGFRVSRCFDCGVAFTWKSAAARPGCPLCGGALSTTTRQLRATFVVLDGELLTLAELTDGGLEGEARYHEADAARQREHADLADAEADAGIRTRGADGWVYIMRNAYDFEVARGITGLRQSTGIRPAGLRDHAAKLDAKAAKLRRRAAKLNAEVAR